MMMPMLLRVIRVLLHYVRRRFRLIRSQRA
jgi:hypothetical protein